MYIWNFIFVFKDNVDLLNGDNDLVTDKRKFRGSLEKLCALRSPRLHDIHVRLFEDQPSQNKSQWSREIPGNNEVWIMPISRMMRRIQINLTSVPAKITAQPYWQETLSFPGGVSLNLRNCLWSVRGPETMLSRYYPRRDVYRDRFYTSSQYSKIWKPVLLRIDASEKQLDFTLAKTQILQELKIKHKYMEIG